MIAPSQGVHLVFDRDFLPGDERHHGAAHQRRPRAVRHPLARPHPRGHHRHAGRPRPPSSRGPSRPRSTSSSRTPSATSASRPPARTCSRVFVGIRPLVRLGRRQEHRRPLPRPHHPHRRLRSAHHRRRQVDDLPEHGRGLRQPGGGPGSAPGAALRHASTSTSTAFTATASEFGPLAVYGSDALGIQDLMQAEPGLRAPSTRRCPIAAPKSCGRPVSRWRGRSRTCWPGAPAPSS